MALSKKGTRKIEVKGETFLWRVRRKISHSEQHNDQVGIPVQHDSGGQLLIIFAGYSRSVGYGRDSLEKVTPSMIRDFILEAIDLGWKFHEENSPIALVEGKLLKDTKTPKYRR